VPRILRPPVDLVLYVSATSTYAATAIRNCQSLLTRFDPAAVRFEVCDVAAHPERADEDAVCYTPLLVKRSPLPRTYLVGDLSNAALLLDLLSACGLEPAR
jgi:two-component system response regulator GlrR